MSLRIRSLQTLIKQEKVIVQPGRSHYLCMDYKEISYDSEDGVATLTLNRPDVYNAFTEQTIRELNHAIERFRTDDGVYVCLLTGAGDGFCAGADVSSMPDWKDKGKKAYGDFLREVQNVVKGVRHSSKPTIAAVNGPAIGAGCDFALACDIRVMGSDAILREGFVKVGLVPGDGGAWLLPKLVGEAKARELLLTGRDIEPKEAQEMGLAAEVSENPVQRANDLAKEILSLPAHAVRRTNDLIDPHQSFEDHCEEAINYQWDCVNDSEHKEAVAAFRDKRAPSYERKYS